MMPMVLVAKERKDVMFHVSLSRNTSRTGAGGVGVTQRPNIWPRRGARGTSSASTSRHACPALDGWDCLQMLQELAVPVILIGSAACGRIRAGAKLVKMNGTYGTHDLPNLAAQPLALLTRRAEPRSL